MISMVEEWGNPPEALLGAEPLRNRPGMVWMDPNRSDGYSIAWSKALFVLDRTLAHTLRSEVSLVGTRSRWEVVKDEHRNVVRHTLQMEDGETVKLHQGRVRSAHQDMEKVYRRKNAVDKLPSESQRVMSYMNSLSPALLKRVNEALSRDKIRQEEVNWSIATTYAADVEIEANMGYEWGRSESHRGSRQFDDDDVDKGTAAPRRKRNNRRSKRGTAVIWAVPATSAAADKQRSEWTAPEKSAIRRYAKEKMRPWDEVTYKEVAASQGGIAAWQKRVAKELTPAQKKFWAEQDEAQKAAHGQDQGTPKPKPKPTVAQARPTAAKRTTAQELVDTTESDTDDEDFWTVQYPVTVLEGPVDQGKQAAAVKLRQALETADALVPEEDDEVTLKRTAATGLLQALEAADAQVRWFEYCSSENQECDECGCSGEEVCLEGLCHECCDRSRGTCLGSEPEQEQCAECGDGQEECQQWAPGDSEHWLCSEGLCEPCCDMGGCGCMERGRREQVQMQMRAEQDNDMSISSVIEGSHPVAVSSGEESDGYEQGNSMVKTRSGADRQGGMQQVHHVRSTGSGAGVFAVWHVCGLRNTERAGYDS